MSDPAMIEETGAGTARHWLGLLGAALGTILTFGAITGFVMASMENGDASLDAKHAAILAAMLAVLGVLLAVCWRLGRRLLGAGARVPTRERRSRNILLLSGAMGAVAGIILSAVAIGNAGIDDPFAMFSSGPIPPLLAIAMVLFLVTVLPFLSWQWQRTIDEHERDAYRAGAVSAAYLFLILAPAWWLLWRGGLVPEPNGVILYLAFNFTFLAVWFWKKYS